MSHQVIFSIVAVVLTVIVIGIFAGLLLCSSRKKESDAALRESLGELKDEYAHAQDLLKSGEISAEEFADREEELALRVLEESAPTTEARERTVANLPAVTTAACAVFISAVTVGAYLWQGDFSALDERAIEQVRMTKEAVKSQRNMAQTVTQLEKAVESNRDNLEAWELLAEQYASTGNLSQAALAYENVTRLNPKDAKAWTELADLTIALDPNDLVKAGDLAGKALAIDPWDQKGLMIGAAAAFEKGDYAQSAVFFSRLLKQIPEGNEVHDALQQQLEMTLQAGNLKEVPADTVGEKPKTDLDRMMELGGGAAPGADLAGDQGSGKGPFGL